MLDFISPNDIFFQQIMGAYLRNHKILKKLIQVNKLTLNKKKKECNQTLTASLLKNLSPKSQHCQRI